MLNHLKLTHVGPASSMELGFAPRLNLITGDNGLGKSFLLDIAWWALTRRWPAEVNKHLTAGLMALPQTKTNGKAAIAFSFRAKSKTAEEYQSTFDRPAQAWTGRAGRPANPGLVLYAQVDGSFAVWDPARNYWRKKGNIDVQDRPPAYVFTAREVWDGLRDEERGPLSNGLIADWAGWQKENGAAYKSLCAVLRALAPVNTEPIEPGELTRISLDDPRDMPTLRMPYGQSVPVVHASAGMRRMIALAYLLVWSWEEHLKASHLLGQSPTSQVIFLIDEIEAHLHPRWQRKIVGALLDVMKALAATASVQVIAATHSPLVMASVETFFDPTQDAWFDLDFVHEPTGERVVLQQRDFVRHGDVCNWLTSEAFDLPSARSVEAENLLEEAARLLDDPDVTATAVEQMHQQLIAMLSPLDPFLFRWRAIGEKKGLLR
jgi:predicted ATPase